MKPHLRACDLARLVEGKAVARRNVGRDLIGDFVEFGVVVHRGCSCGRKVVETLLLAGRAAAPAHRRDAADQFDVVRGRLLRLVF